MTKPKKWYIDSDDDLKNVLKRSDGELFKKPNATSPLGPVLTVEVPLADQCGKNSPSECVLVSLYNNIGFTIKHPFRVAYVRLISSTVQFNCKNGRIVLCLKFHEWNKSAISSMFRQVASSTDFVSTWGSEVINNSAGDQISISRKRPISSSSWCVDTSPAPSLTPEDSPNSASSAKRQCSNGYNVAGIDERIESCKKGKKINGLMFKMMKIELKCLVNHIIVTVIFLLYKSPRNLYSVVL